VRDRKPSAGFWITVTLVAVLVGYPLSFGPAVRLYAKLENPVWLANVLNWAPDPIEWIINIAPYPIDCRVARHYGKYLDWWRGLPH
jgi:hypothetical protein